MILRILPFWLLAMGAAAKFDHSDMAHIATLTERPDEALKELGTLEVLGNSSLDTANIVFLPEVHDDPKSLLVQLLIIARERQSDRAFVVLDESLTSMQKSVWDIFSQKSLEILAAKQERVAKKRYAPRSFEMTLQKLAKELNLSPGRLQQIENLWVATDYAKTRTPFYGWDRRDKATLTERNIQMVKSLDNVLANNKRILVMAGARHVPELEFLTSQKLICPRAKTNNIANFFSGIERKFGAKPEMALGIGATAPIYKYLKDKKYAVVLNTDLYGELDRVVSDFYPTNRSCINL